MIPIKDYRISSPYGYRILKGKKEFHDGIDFVSTSGDTNVYAIANGLVEYDMDNYNDALRWVDKHHSGGNMIIVKHTINGNYYYARYLHLGQNTVSKNDFVNEGDVLGQYGDYGYSFGAHLHFDMYDKKWRKIDPSAILGV
jgi:murein DD-endopeptidase MepM/ murein hydrolase activator NlpD